MYYRLAETISYNKIKWKDIIHIIIIVRYININIK